jgi:hypothetical protein
MDTKVAERDPTLACAAYKRHRVYFFSKRLPDDVEDAAVGARRMSTSLLCFEPSRLANHVIIV